MGWVHESGYPLAYQHEGADVVATDRVAGLVSLIRDRSPGHAFAIGGPSWLTYQR